jgi:hypothetical protein
VKLPPVVWVVILALSAGAAGLGLHFGGREALDEGAVIVFYAERYAARTGEPREDCHGRPGRRDDVWLVVLCEGAAGRFAYPVGHDGALMTIDGEEA